MLKKILIVVLALIGLIAVAFIGLNIYTSSTVNSKLSKTYSVPDLKIDEEVQNADIELGKRLVTRVGCNECHGPDLSGNQVMDNFPMGKIYGANITPAKLKDWTNEEIARAIRHGISKDGRLLILMPSHEYSEWSKGDLAAVIGYIRSVPPVEKDNIPVKLGPVPKALITFEKAPTLISAQVIEHEKKFNTKPEVAPTAEYGRYLAVTSCSGCHNPNYTGGPIPGGDPSWPPAGNLTKMKEWKKENFVSVVTKGERLDGTKVKSPMPTYTNLNETELEAFWKFFNTL